MPTEKQRREAARRHLERQTERRRQREIRRRRATLITSIAGTVVLIAAIVVTIVLLGNGNNSPSTQAAGNPTSTAPLPSAATAAPQNLPPTPFAPAKGKSVTFDGVTVTGAKDLSGQPTVTSTGKHAPSHLAYKDLVVGTGKRASTTSTVSVQYIGALYKTGKVFNNSYAQVQPVSFSLQPGKVIPGFSKGIGGAKGIPPMRAGGRRLLILPPQLAYGASPPAGSKIPKNATLIFLIDLKQVS